MSTPRPDFQRLRYLLAAYRDTKAETPARLAAARELDLALHPDGQLAFLLDRCEQVEVGRQPSPWRAWAEGKS